MQTNKHADRPIVPSKQPRITFRGDLPPWDGCTATCLPVFCMTACGRLSHQIEHHLFPSICHTNYVRRQSRSAPLPSCCGTHRCSSHTCMEVHVALWLETRQQRRGSKRGWVGVHGVRACAQFGCPAKVGICGMGWDGNGNAGVGRRFTSTLLSSRRVPNLACHTKTFRRCSSLSAPLPLPPCVHKRAQIIAASSALATSAEQRSGGPRGGRSARWVGSSSGTRLTGR